MGRESARRASFPDLPKIGGGSKGEYYWWSRGRVLVKVPEMAYLVIIKVPPDRCIGHTP